MKRTKFTMTVCGIILAAGALGGCAGSGAKSPNVADNVRHQLDQAGLNSVKVSQDSDKRVVTLTGDVQSDSDKAQAESIAKSAAAGEVVSNQVAVVPPSDREASKVNADLDEGIEKNLDAALVRDKLKHDVSYDVKNGVVTLTGTVPSERRRADAERVAKNVPDVAQVVNEIQIKNQKATSTR